MSQEVLYGAIEAGGTKFVCALGDGSGQLLECESLATRDPASTLKDVFAFFAAAENRCGRVRAFGVGSFGPLELRRRSARFGYITNTPKSGWKDFDLRGLLAQMFGRPVAIDTDVNAAALAEMRWGSGRELTSLAYVTVGTGVGAGVVHEERAVHGLMHPEVGHLMVRKHPDDAAFAGICPYHGDCIEGLASGPAIVARTGRRLSELPKEHGMWSLEAYYLGQLAAALVLGHSPERILFGGGVMQSGTLFPRMHAAMLDCLRGYLPHVEIADPQYLQPPGLAQFSGVKGALALAARALEHV